MAAIAKVMYGGRLGENTDQSTPAPQPGYPPHLPAGRQPEPGKRYHQVTPPRPVASGARITAGLLSVVLGIWMLVCSGLVFMDAFESFTDTRLVAAVVLILALATLIMGFVCLSPAWDHRWGFALSGIGVLAAAVVGSLLVFNSYGLLLLIPALLLGFPSILLLVIEARKA